MQTSPWRQRSYLEDFYRREILLKMDSRQTLHCTWDTPSLCNKGERLCTQVMREKESEQSGQDLNMSMFKMFKYIRVPWWLSQLCDLLLISAQVSTSGSQGHEFKPCIELSIHAEHGAHLKKKKVQINKARNRSHKTRTCREKKDQKELL